MMTNAVLDTCKSCGSRLSNSGSLYRAHGVPASSCAPAADKDTALRVPRGNIDLVCCERCAFVFNRAYDCAMAEYNEAYEDRQSFSATFNAFQEELVDYLVKKYDLHNKNILEIGCGTGDFIKKLCRAGGNRGIGIDPRCVEAGDAFVSFVPEYFGVQHACFPADFFCCRHTLEHIADPARFVMDVRTVVSHRAAAGVFFEVPDAARILRENAFWDIQYEHCSYFTTESITRLFRACGFEITHTAVVYSSQYLTVEARPAPTGLLNDCREDGEAAAEVIAAADCFRKTTSGAINYWNTLLAESRGRKVVIWGSGAKCQGFMSAVPAAVECVRYVVDVNPFLHGRFMMGTGLEIKAPQFLGEYRPDLVIIMNPIYRSEIVSALESMLVRAEVLVLGLNLETS